MDGLNLDFSNLDNGWNEKRGREPGEVNAVVSAGVRFEFSWIPGGVFTMGDERLVLRGDNPEIERQNPFEHTVELTRGFWLQTTQTTRAQWKGIVGDLPGDVEADELPVTDVSWDECQEFVAKLNESNVAPVGLVFSLPTEAQWERACRADTTTFFWWGDEFVDSDADDDDFVARPANTRGNFPWSKGIEEKRRLIDGSPKKVGCYRHNPWGLYDTHGNVYEWCLDVFAPLSREAEVDPCHLGTEEEGTNDRCCRGGCFCSSTGCPSAFRYGRPKDQGDRQIGMRLALVQGSN